MARQEKKTYDLSEAEQRDLVTLIQQGKALPEKYRFVLFEDKREVELVWNGKTRDVCTTVSKRWSTSMSRARRPRCKESCSTVGVVNCGAGRIS
jgi:hypothetical protein